MVAVNINASANASAALSAYDAMLRKKDEAIRKLRQVARESKTAGDANVRGARQMGQATSVTLSNIVQMAGAYFGLRQTLGLITSEMREQRRIAEETLRANENMAEAAARATRVTTGVFAPGELGRHVSRISTAGGVAEREVYQGFAAVGATGVSPAAQIQAVETAAQFRSVFGDELGPLAGRLAQFSQVGGVSPEAAGGFLLRTRQQLDVRDFKTFVQRIAPSLIGATRAGGTLEGATELAATLQQAQPELRGTSAKYAADVFQRVFQEAGVPVMEGGRVDYRTLAQAAPGVTSFAQFLPFIQEQLQAIPETERADALNRLLVGTGGARAELRALFTGEAGARGRFARIQAGVAGPSEADAALVRETIAEAEVVPAVSLGLATGQRVAATQRVLRQREGAATEAEALTTIRDIMQASGAGRVYRFFAETAADVRMGGTPAESIGELERLRTRIEQPSGRGPLRRAGQVTPFGGLITAGLEAVGFREPRFDELEPDERGQLTQAINEMIRLLKNVERNTAAINETMNMAAIPVG